MSIADTGGGGVGSGRGSLDRRKYAADAMRSARKSKSNDFLDRLDGGTGRFLVSPYLEVQSCKRFQFPMWVPISMNHFVASSAF